MVTYKNSRKEKKESIDNGKGNHLPKPCLNRRNFIKFVSAGVFSLYAEACQQNPVTRPVITALNQPPTDVVNETVPIVSAESNQGAVTAPVDTQQVVTPESLKCELNPVSELFSKGLKPSKTNPVLSQSGYEEAFSGQDVIQGITGQISSDLSRVVETGTEDVRQVIIPEYVRKEDVARQIFETTGVNPHFEIVNYQKDMTMNSDKAFLEAVHAGVNGWTTAFWGGSKLETRSDDSYRINGLLHKVVEVDNELELRTIPGQRFDERMADIAIVSNCGPKVVAIKSNYQVEAVFDPEVDFVKQPDKAWIVLESYSQVLSDEEKKEKKINGYAFESTGKVNGLTTKVTVVTSKNMLSQLDGLGAVPFHLNSKLGGDNDPENSSQRLSEMIRIGDYLGYLEDQGFQDSEYPFDKYMEDLKNGKDRKYKIYGSGGQIIIDPNKTHEIIYSYEILDAFHGNASLYISQYSRVGYISLADGGVRIILTVPYDFFDAAKNRFSEEDGRHYLASAATGALMNSMVALGWDEKTQKYGPMQKTNELLDFNRSSTLQKLNNLYGTEDLTVYNKLQAIFTIEDSS